MDWILLFNNINISLFFTSAPALVFHPLASQRGIHSFTLLITKSESVCILILVRPKHALILFKKFAKIMYKQHTRKLPVELTRSIALIVENISALLLVCVPGTLIDKFLI